MMTPVKKKQDVEKRKKIKPYSSSRIISRNYLSNISYTGVKEEDLYDRNFAFDTYVLITKNLNSFSLERKIFDPKNREIVYMFWDECIDPIFYRHICEKEKFLYLNRKNWLCPRSTDIVWNFIEKHEYNFEKLKKKLIKNEKIFQFVYSRCYPEIPWSKNEG